MLTFNNLPEAVTILLERTQFLEDSMRKLMANSAPLQAAEAPITQKETAAYLGVTPQTLIRWEKRKKIKSLRTGSTVRYQLSDVLKALGK